MKLPIKELNSRIKDKLPVKEAEEKVNELYNTILSFFEDRMDRIENKLEDSGVIKTKTSKLGIVLGTLAGLAVGATAALKLPVDEISSNIKDFKIPVKDTGKKVNHLYNNALSFFGNAMHNVEDKMEDVGLIERKNTGPGIFLGAIAGLAVGAAAALLLAKDKGEDFRNKLSDQFEKTKDQLMAKKEETLHFAKNETENVKNAASAQTKDFTHHI
ncbi:MAG: YtxH domain-containing protein [Bacteroidota bacterium]|jgi:hypothetical protein|nr:YtxH domain-containing protein [Bacteroidota bacterium]